MFEDIAHRAERWAREKGADVEVAVIREEKESVSVSNGEVEKVEKTCKGSLGVRVIRDGRQGTLSVGYIPQGEDIYLLLEEALNLCKYASPDERPLGDSKRGFFSLKEKGYPDIREKERFLRELDGTLRSGRNVTAVRALCLWNVDREVRIWNTKGLLTGREFSLVGCHGQVILEGKNGHFGKYVAMTERRWNPERILKRMEREVRIGEIIANAKPLGVGRLPVIFTGIAAVEMVRILGQATLGEPIRSRRSFLSGKVGRKVASDAFVLVDDPTVEEGVGSFPYDDEGTPTRRKEVISEGVFKTPLVDLYTARALGVSPTGNGFNDTCVPRPSFTNLLLVGSEKEIIDILKCYKKALLITDLMGTHLVNLTSGDFSFGAHGVLIRDGKLAEGVMGVTVSGNLLEVMEKTVEVGGETNFFGNVGSPSFVVEDLNVAGRGT